MQSQKRTDDQIFFFPSDRAETHLIAADKTIARLCRLAGLTDVTLHTLRHAFASVAADMGYSELTIAGLLGHASLGITQRYMHLEKALGVAADDVSGPILGLLIRLRRRLSGVLRSNRPRRATFAQKRSFAIGRFRDGLLLVFALKI